MSISRNNSRINGFQSTQVGQSFGLTAGFDSATRECPNAEGPFNQELSRSSPSSSATLSSVAPANTSNGPSCSQVSQYQASFGKKTRGYLIPAR